MQLRIRKLRLRAKTPGHLNRGAETVERAFRGASLAEDGRLYVVRRFSLGEIALDTRPERLAQVVSRKFAALRARARHASAPGAETADIVWFQDENEALELLLTHALLGETASAWFWSKAIPGVTAQGSHVLGRLMHAIAACPLAPLILLGAVSRAVQRDQRRTLERLKEVELSLLCEPLGVSSLELHPARTPGDRRALKRDTAASAPEPATTGSCLAQALAAALTIWQRDEPRLHWFAALIVLERRPSLAVWPVALLAESGRWLSSVVPPPRPALADGPAESEPMAARNTLPSADASSREATWPKRPAPSRPATPAASLPAESSGPARDGAADQDYGASPAHSDRAHESRAADPSAAPGASASELASPESVGAQAPSGSDPWSSLSPEPTEAGGLLFMVRVLRTLGIDDTLQGDEALEFGLAARALVFIARGAGVPADDPLCRALSALGGPAPGGGWSWRAPAVATACLDPRSRRRWERRSALVLPEGHPAHRRSVLRVLIAIRDACDLYCREQLDLSLAAVVLRSAMVAASSTHIDIGFSLDAADVRVRMTGLDVDPGWVPWLGRVVLFHYGDLGGSGPRER